MSGRWVAVGSSVAVGSDAEVGADVGGGVVVAAGRRVDGHALTTRMDANRKKLVEIYY